MLNSLSLYVNVYSVYYHQKAFAAEQKDREEERWKGTVDRQTEGHKPD